MTVTHEGDYQRRVPRADRGRMLPGTAIEILRERRNGAPPLHVLFDFDGTLSLIREGWPEVMTPMMVDVLRATGTSESDEELRALVMGFVMELTGKQTIYQMIRLAEEVAKRGAVPEDPLVYKQRYHELLMERIADRREALRCGAVPPERYLVPGSLDLLRGLKARGVTLYLASGTDERYVREEAELLGLTPYFGAHIHGAVDDYKTFSKQLVIERILSENKIDGSRLLGFGDGYVEIDNIVTAGGIAVAVASNEANPGGPPDAWKRERLIGVGADIVVADYREHEALLAYLWGET